MQDAFAYKEYKNIAKSVLKNYRIKGKIRTQNLHATVKKDFNSVTRVYRMAKKLEKSGEALPSAFEWIADNYYMIEQSAHLCMQALKRGGRISAATVKEGKNSHAEVPVYYDAFYEYIHLCGNTVDEDVLEAFISACDRSGSTRPDFADFYSFQLLFSCAVISKLAKTCKTMLDNRHSAGSEETAAALGKWVASMFFLSEYSFDKSFDSCETEELLRLDPSGYYSCMTKETKDIYRSRVAYLADKKGISETELVREALEKARNADSEKMKHIGAYLYPQTKKMTGVLYFASLLVFSCSVTVMLTAITPFAILLVFPVWETVKQICDRVFSLFVRTPPLPRLDLAEIPDTDGVLVVITTLLFGGVADDGIFDRLEKMYLSNGMKNVYFAVLGDYPDSNAASTSDDAAILGNAENRISALNTKYPGSFFLFMRNRKYSKTQGKFMGYERKRGAVAELTGFLCGKENTDFIINKASMSRELCSSIRYVVTLDADTNLPLDAVRELAGTMLHPLNRPVIDKKTHTVVSGYGIMQPRIAPELSAARKTAFAGIMCGAGGIDVYSFAQFDLYQSVFGEAVFCGKGIFDKYAFNEVINHPDTEFAEDTVLSHDILEGARLRCALINDLEVTDGFPKNELSYVKRHHRWVRGDLQNLVFLKNTFVNKNGERVKNNISPLSKFKLFDNFRRAAVPVVSFAGIIIANFLNPKAAAYMTLFSVFYLMFPFISDFSEMISTFGVQCAARRFFSKGVTSGIWQSFIRMLTCIAMLPKNACVTFDAFIRCFWRMNFTRKNMLEWVTAAQSDTAGDDGILYYVQKNLFGAFFGALQFLVSPYGVLKLIGMLWFFFPAAAYAAAAEKKKERIIISKEQKKKISAYASDMWKYFENTVNADESFLPIDNVQFYPAEKKAHRTSPTNIGLYLASVLCARDFGIIDTDNMYTRLNNTITTVEKLEKWNGHLYNWYNTETLEVMPPKCISSVDSGNFLACLIVLKEGIKEYANENTGLLDIVIRVKALFENTDIGKLYNSRRNLFSLGVSVENGNAVMSPNCFDMLMSEARTLSYIALACRKVPKIHSRYLSRPLIKHSDRVGIASWTGTAFEYFMPAMFMPAVKGSLMYEALRYAFYCQRKRRAKAVSGEVWGISESGYFAFDSEMNYEYRAFGIPELGYKRGLEKDLVISPYSSFLSMCLNISLPLENLSRLTKAGAYGKYGFYEAYDFTPGRCSENGVVVKSYMSHHVGMSLVSCANACFDNLFVKRFMNDARMKSAEELLEEKIPVNAVVRKMTRTQYNPTKTVRINRQTPLSS